MDRIIEAMDRKSSVSLSVQLRGALEFGIASGELPADARLPSVRALAARLGIPARPGSNGTDGAPAGGAGGGAPPRAVCNSGWSWPPPAGRGHG